MNNFMETLEKRTLKIITYEVFDFIIAEFREGLENAQIKKKIQKTLNQKGKKLNWWSKWNLRPNQIQ